MKKAINIIGAGLAGVEAAYFLLKRGYMVNLYEKRPIKTTGAHQSGDFAELVCSNSLKSSSLENACGLLKEEMRHLDSLTMKVAHETSVPAGNALSVDRELFAKQITEIIKSYDNLSFINEDIKDIPEGITIVATGPLTSQEFVKTLERLTGEKTFAFFDASAPIIRKESIDFSKAYFKSRYDKGDSSYINCAFDKDEYENFYLELINARTALVHDFDTKYFEGCIPLEVMAKRGEKTLRYGPLKPVGLRKNEDHRPHAVVQLRQDNVCGDLYNIVGFQTNLTYGEQKRVFSLIPGLENAEFVRYGLMHRNTYICAPKCLKKDLSLIAHPHVLIAGQLCGVEGYVESAATGILAGINAMLLYENKPTISPELGTMLGALINYITMCSAKHFTPMNANYGIMYGAEKDRIKVAENSLKITDEWWDKIHGR